MIQVSEQMTHGCGRTAAAAEEQLSGRARPRADASTAIAALVPCVVTAATTNAGDTFLCSHSLRPVSRRAAHLRLRRRRNASRRRHHSFGQPVRLRIFLPVRWLQLVSLCLSPSHPFLARRVLL